MNGPDVLIAGEIFVDWILSGLDAWPTPGKEAFATQFHRAPGGGTAITACALARLGVRCGVIGVLGAADADWVTGCLKSYGVDTSELQFDTTEPTGMTVVVSRHDDRAFLTYAGANRSFPELFAKRCTQSISPARHIHLAFPPPLDSAAIAIGGIHHQGGTVSLDLGWHEEWLADPRALSLLRKVDIFFPNELEARHMTGEQDPAAMLRYYAGAGVNRVALKLGARGAALLWDGDTYFASPHRAESVDTTGAGDCFNAGFLHAWLAGEPPQRCLDEANICGALSTEAHGGIAGFPDKTRLASELAKGQL